MESNKYLTIIFINPNHALEKEIGDEKSIIFFEQTDNPCSVYLRYRQH